MLGENPLMRIRDIAETTLQTDGVCTHPPSHDGRHENIMPLALFNSGGGKSEIYLTKNLQTHTYAGCVQNTESGFP